MGPSPRLVVAVDPRSSRRVAVASAVHTLGVEVAAADHRTWAVAWVDRRLAEEEACREEEDRTEEADRVPVVQTSLRFDPRDLCLEVHNKEDIFLCSVYPFGEEVLCKAEKFSCVSPSVPYHPSNLQNPRLAVKPPGLLSDLSDWALR